MPQWVCVNGALVPAAEARVSVFDAGFMQGIGLFETMRAFGDRVFRLEQHLARLAASARALGWTAEPDAGAITNDVRQVLHATAAEEARVRLTVTTGSLHAGAPDTPGLTVVVSAAPADKYPDECYVRGVGVVVSGCRQSAADPTAGHKTTSYFARLASLRAAHAQGAFEALWLTPEGNAAEAALCSVLAVRKAELLVPPLDTPVLPGITRAALLELAAELRIPVREAAVSLDELRGADEVLLASSMIELLPVVRIGRDAIGNEKPGEVTRELAVALTRRIDEECAQ